mmetsp:Transcript_30513/g.91121  ORF Transcript_30513/g.91121 Transcript_30513/m.91121 type:complete len:92 (+) Transcript_30513:1889-2164(+)
MFMGGGTHAIAISEADCWAGKLAVEHCAVQCCILDGAAPEEDECSTFQHRCDHCGCEEANLLHGLCPMGKGALMNPNLCMLHALVEMVSSG